MFNVKEMGERIRKLRGKRSQDECAKALGISRGALSFYENGDRKPDADVIYMMAEYFEVSADYILGLSQEPNASLEIQAINKLTGLSKKSIDVISLLGSNYRNALNLFIENDNFGVFIAALSQIIKFSNIGYEEFIKSAYDSRYGGSDFIFFDKGEKYSFIEKYINDNILLNQFQASKTLNIIQEELTSNKESIINTLVDELPDSGNIDGVHLSICSEEYNRELEEHNKKVVQSIHEIEKETGKKILFDDIVIEEAYEDAQHNPKEE